MDIQKVGISVVLLINPVLRHLKKILSAELFHISRGKIVFCIDLDIMDFYSDQNIRFV